MIILFYILFLSFSYLEIILKFFGRKKPLLYDRLTKTENISTINYNDKINNNTLNYNNYKDSDHKDNNFSNKFIKDTNKIDENIDKIKLQEKEKSKTSQ